ncbi:hypothetical protein ACFVT2_31325 [Streptomyces sp. NPDC058000]|uniref:hypothetical protein n=1 Tax=Streptomyces sp. NPDC058000 TaxID=3346299 RepID=UPI0036E046D9
MADHITADALAASPTIVDAPTPARRPVAESLQRVEPTLLDAEDTERCGASPGDPAPAITGIAYDADHVPVDAYALTAITGYGIGLHFTRVEPAS